MKILNALLVLIVLVGGIAGIAVVVKNDLMEEYLAEHAPDGDDDDPEPEEDRIHIIHGYKAIELDEEQMETVGLVTSRLSTMDYRPEFTAFASVVDIAPLVSLRTDYENLLAERRIIQTALDGLRSSLERAKALHDARSLSTRELERIRAEVDQKLVKLGAMNTRIENLQYSIRSEWGDVIGNLVLENERQSVFNRIAMHRLALVLLSLPRDRSLEDTEQNVYISRTGGREDALPASYLDNASRSGNPLYGESYFYLLESEKLRAGMRLFAWVEEPGEVLKGLFVPDRAVIWYANEPWVYIQHEETIFIRIPLPGARKVESGWFLADGIEPDDLVVTAGGQTLLSEEFKWAIPDEDDD